MDLEKELFAIKTAAEFQAIALQVFRFQAEACAPYRDFLQHLGVRISDVNDLEDIPFLPISFFKNKKVYAAKQQAEESFLSSGTTGMQQSRHEVARLELYNQSIDLGFAQFYGAYPNFHVFGLLPSYLERKGSSLIKMVERWYAKSNQAFGGFYLYDYEKLYHQLQRAQKESHNPILLIGVTFALLDFAEAYPEENPGVTLIETGGMKGRKKELIREELHATLDQSLRPKAIHSEYGMTELLSQAYAKNGKRFTCPPWMRVFARKLDDPLQPSEWGETGALNIMDLANLYSCSFIATDDVGRVFPDGDFEVLGRIDAADVRGCSLLVGQ